MNTRKGIILAGGKGTRLYPITNSISKQILPVYDKPMIYYPLTTLMSAGIREILIITTPNDQNLFKNLLGDGKRWGMEISYAIQVNPDGLAQAFKIGSKFINNSNVALILGDNLFHGENLNEHFSRSIEKEIGATIFAYPVRDPERYGVIEFGAKGQIIGIDEKPKKPKSRYAVTGIYFYDNQVIDYARQIKPSKRGELEITDLNMIYLKNGLLNVEIMGKGIAWLDTGNHDSLFEASGYIRTMEKRQGFKIGCPEEVAWTKGWISDNDLELEASRLFKSGYGEYLIELLKSK